MLPKWKNDFRILKIEIQKLRNVIQMAQLLTKFDTAKLHGVDGSPQLKQTSNKTLM